MAAARSSKNIFRIVSPTAILGYGFPAKSLAAALQKPVDLIAADAGSVDPGPNYLATRSSFTAFPQVRRDLRLMLQAALRKQCKLVIGSAGGCGTDNQVEAMEEEVLVLLRELGAPPASRGGPRVATVTSELKPSLVRKVLPSLRPLGWMPDISAAQLDASVFVAQMGVEPIMAALEHAEVVLCGRAYDPAVFAAEPLRQGFPAALALHASKVLECGAIAASPGSGSDCFVAELHREPEVAIVEAPSEDRQATPLSVAAHTLYEKSHPHCFMLPGGVLCTHGSRFLQVGRAVEISGTTFTPSAATVKLEGAAVRGHRAVALSLAVDSEVASSLLPDNVFAYGREGVERRALTSGEQELGLLVSVFGGTPAQNASVLSMLRARLLHFGFPGRLATAGNLAFPFSPSDLKAADGTAITVAGTRDPAFIGRWQDILQEVQARVEEDLASEAPGPCQIRILPCGLEGQPLLLVAEAVAETVEEAQGQLPALPGSEQWVCDGGKAADWTLHHLLDVDEALMQEIFSVKVLSGDGVGGSGAERRVPVKALNWAGPSEPLASQSSDYHRCLEHSTPAAGQGQGQLAGLSVAEAAVVVRSKNSGINEIGFDVIFKEKSMYDAAFASPAWRAAEDLEALLALPVLGVYFDATSLAVKVTCRRLTLAGSAGDRDVYGAQQHAALLRLRF